ncbi:MAG: PAS domain S-box protein [Methanofollis sp.]|uniref:PAS domain S-box protein n=1 Tax=Methanofollis sp. TaxID=2052835 RepID=UPI00261D538B|nr:PAS domain S-box protein [Methanofollis sp.]MDD4255491.1 PAS domain S-box protein [Methanofollis sp.]
MVFLAIIFFLILLLPSASAAASPEKNVLLLHSYHEGLSWTDGVTDGVYTAFDEGTTDVNLYIEYMDTPRIASPRYSAEIAGVYRLKYADVRLDAIICSDEYAFHFLREHHDALFPGTPAIFCGVNYFEDEYLVGWENCTGIVEVADVQGTVDAAISIDPGVREVYVVNDNTLTGIADRKVVEGVAQGYEGRVAFTIPENQTLEETKEDVGRLPPDTVVLLMTLTRDAKGTYYEYDDVIEAVSGTSRVPVYSVWEVYMGEGLTGGKLLSSEDQGREAGMMALRVLNGEPASSIPVKKDPQGRYVFDYAQLKRFGLENATLPIGSTVINSPPPSVEIDRTVAVGAAFAIATLGIAVLFLGYTVRIRRRSERALKESEEKFRSLAERSFDLIFATDADGLFTYVSPAVHRISGYKPGEFLGKNFAFNREEADRSRFESFFADLREGKAIEGLAVRIRAKDGSERYLEINAAPILNSGVMVGAQGVARDVTERMEMERVRAEAYARIEQNIAQFATLGDEIRNPLAVIVGIADLHCEGHHAGQILEQAEIIDGIITALDRGWIESEKVREYLRKH